MSLEGHPKDLESFYLKHPSFVWGPALVAGSFTLLTKMPRVAAHFEQMGSTPYGVQWSAAYALYGIVLCFATHGWYCTFVEQDRQLQSYNPKGSAKDAAQLSYAERPQPRAGAVRSMATFATSLVYTVVPLAPATTSWATFAAWTCALAVYWDLHFFCVHAFAHENRHAYKFLHKLHHIYKQPDVYSAYFVTYQVPIPRVIPTRSPIHRLSPPLAHRRRAHACAPAFGGSKVVGRLPPRAVALLHGASGDSDRCGGGPARRRLHLDPLVRHPRLVHQAWRPLDLIEAVALPPLLVGVPRHVPLAVEPRPRRRDDGGARLAP